MAVVVLREIRETPGKQSQAREALSAAKKMHLELGAAGVRVLGESFGPDVRRVLYLIEFADLTALQAWAEKLRETPSRPLADAVEKGTLIGSDTAVLLRDIA